MKVYRSGFRAELEEPKATKNFPKLSHVAGDVKKPVKAGVMFYYYK